MKNYLQTLRALFLVRLDEFRTNTRGAVAAFVAGGIISMVGVVGLATDAARGYMVKARLGQALDAAALAGGREIYSPTRDADIQMFFNANFPPGFLGATVTGPQIQVSANNEKLTLTASATIDTTFMKVLGINDLNVSTTTEVTRETTYLDVVLAIDMSGSMSSWTGGQTRIQAARTAATDLVNILFGTEETKDLLNIGGVVPWNGKVNVTRNGTAFDPRVDGDVRGTGVHESAHRHGPVGRPFPEQFPGTATDAAAERLAGLRVFTVSR